MAQRVSEAAGASPLSRFATTLTNLGDEKKPTSGKILNLLTGANMTDVDLPLQEQIAVRDRVMKELAGTPGLQQWQELNVPQDKIAGMTLWQQAL